MDQYPTYCADQREDGSPTAGQRLGGLSWFRTRTRSTAVRAVKSESGDRSVSARGSDESWEDVGEVIAAHVRDGF